MRWLALLIAVAACAVAAASPAASQGAFEVEPGSATVELLNASGDPETRAGSHPDKLISSFVLTREPDGTVAENLKDVQVEFPAGLMGDPAATPLCRRADFLASSCPAESQVGIARPEFAGLGQLELPVHNIEPVGDELAEIGFLAFIVGARFSISVSPASAGLTLLSRNLPQEVPMYSSELELWGIPADHQSGTSIPRRAFLTTPTDCRADVTSSLRIDTWEAPGAWRDTALEWPRFTDCSSLPFSAQMEVAAGAAADSPAGFTFALDVPQVEGPDGRATSHLEGVELTLPPGFSLSPGVANGLGVCTEAELGSREAAPARCPADSQLGVVRMRSPAITGTLVGRLYLGEPQPDGAFLLFIVVERPGLAVKASARMRADPASGRLTAVLSGLPQLPLSRLEMEFWGGPRAALASPPTCRSGETAARLTPYNGAAAVVLRTQVVTASAAGRGPCGPRRFAPGLLAGATSALAGAPSGLTMTVSRADGEQLLGGLAVALPEGMAARLGAVERCAPAAAEAGSCPPSSRVGSVAIEAGVGPSPLVLSGGVHLTEPHRRSPLGLVMQVPVDVGPFQFGVASIGAGLDLDPETGRLSVTTDPFPQIVAGIPLRLRAVAIDVDRPGFMINPTSCGAGRVEATIRSAEGGSAWPSVPFAVHGCRRLPFSPRLAVAATAGSGRRPGVRMAVRSRAGEANLASLTLRLPRELGLNRRTGAIACTRIAFLREECPGASSVGRSRAVTPLLARPLSGPVRPVRAAAVGAPELWSSLRGDGLALTVRNRTSLSADGRLVSSIERMPDLPIRSLTTELRAGARSLFSSRRPLCGLRRRLFAEATLVAHSGARLERLVPVQLRPCRGQARAGRSAHLAG